MLGRDKNKVRRFTPLDAVQGKGNLSGGWVVRYYNERWRVEAIEVVAQDELGAFAHASVILRSKRWSSVTDHPLFISGAITLGVGVFFLMVALVSALIGKN